MAQSLAPLKQTLERIPDLDPAAQDARRLMSIHLPGLVDRYLHVPPAYRTRPRRRRQDRRPAARRSAGRRPRGAGRHLGAAGQGRPRRVRNPRPLHREPLQGQEHRLTTQPDRHPAVRQAAPTRPSPDATRSSKSAMLAQPRRRQRRHPAAPRRSGSASRPPALPARHRRARSASRDAPPAGRPAPGVTVLIGPAGIPASSNIASQSAAGRAAMISAIIGTSISRLATRAALVA